MLRPIIVSALLMVSSLGAQSRDGTAVKWTGWFSDKQCARITPGEEPRPNGTACVKKCLEEGTPPVFISEQARAIYEVPASASVKDDVGYYVEITGVVDEKGKAVFVKSVKRLAEVTAACLLPRKIGSR